jgi:hypothetical protein
MPRMRRYGVLCTACGDAILLGTTELSADAQDADLRDKLFRQEWRSSIVGHLPDSECKLQKLYTLDDLILLD